MKYILIVSFLLSAISFNYGRWIQQNSGTTENLQAVQFLNNSVGFVVGDNGTFLKTTDGGNTWNQLSAPIGASLYGVHMLSENLGWIAVSNGEIYKTQDGGISWILQQTGTTDPIFNIQFVDENHGWASKFFNEILLTTNSGTNWVSYPTGINNIILAMFFTDLNTGWVGGWGGTVMKTIDGGLSWTPQYSGTSITRKSLFFLNNNLGWSAGGGGGITKTINGGASWTLLNSGASEFFNSIFFTNADTGWVAGQDKVYVSFDGGTTWSNQLYEYGKNFTDLWFERSDLGWLVGYEGLIYKYAYAPTLHVLYPNGGENLLVGHTENIGWESADLDSIKIEYSTDGGLNWVVIVEKVPATPLSFNWEIPNSPSPSCYIRISNLDSPALFDISDGLFSISRSPQIIFPDGGEYLYINQPYQFTWNHGGSQYLAIELSRDNGNNWEMISDSVQALPGNFTWIATPPRSDQCRLKIIDGEYPDFYDISQSTFLIDSLYSPHHYFPLEPGTAWYFHGWYPIQTIFEVEKDTLLSDGYFYAKINRHDLTLWWWTWPLTRTEFVRQSGDSVLIYPDSLLLDFNWQSGDTVFFSSNHYAYIYALTVQNLFNRPVNTYTILSSIQGAYSFSDGIGYNTIPEWLNYAPRYLVGCIIDSMKYGNVIVPIIQNKTAWTEGYHLEQNYPNPFNSTTVLNFCIPKREQVTLTIYDLSGRKVKTILNKEVNPGEHSVTFQADFLPSGIYFYQMIAGEYTECRKFMLIK